MAKKMEKYGKDLLWMLGEIANSDVDQIDALGEIEVVGEGDTSTDVGVIDIIGAAVERINEQAAQLEELEASATIATAALGAFKAEAIKSLRDHHGRLAPTDAEYFDPEGETFYKIEKGVLRSMNEWQWRTVTESSLQDVHNHPSTICLK